MSLISRLPTLTGQKAVWWARTGDDETGAPIYTNPVEISVRWEDRMEEYIDAAGETRMSSAVVYPDRVLAPKDLLWLGTLATLADPIPDNWAVNYGAREVSRFEKLPSFRGRETLLTAYL